MIDTIYHKIHIDHSEIISFEKFMSNIEQQLPQNQDKIIQPQQTDIKDSIIQQQQAEVSARVIKQAKVQHKEQKSILESNSKIASMINTGHTEKKSIAEILREDNRKKYTEYIEYEKSIAKFRYNGSAFKTGPKEQQSILEGTGVVIKRQKAFEDKPYESHYKAKDMDLLGHIDQNSEI